MKFSEKFSNRLLNLKFASIVTGIALTITFVGFLLYKQERTGNTEQVAKKVNQSNSLPSLSPIPSASPVTLSENIDNSKLTYNITTAPKLIKSKKLQSIVDKIVSYTKKNKFPTQRLSITIINLKTSEYAGYQQEILRYPASVVKLFWMVYLYAQIEKGILSEAEFTQYLDSMIKKSDNEAGSYIVDRITKTQYRKNLNSKEYKNWSKKRLQINKYFQKAGYDKINVSQKTFPIPSLKLSRPKGSELKLIVNSQKQIFNKISTKQVARLLYEIYKNKSISAIYSQKMAKILTIDSITRNLKKDDKNLNEFNPVRGFLSEPLPDNIHFMGKAGWTSSHRNDAAIIATPDAKTAYILVVFAENKAYASNWKIFPKISRLVFNRMINQK